MKSKRYLRVGLGCLTLTNVQLGAWALFAPRSFYDGFPGLGRGWISIDGPYNEHLIRDFGALNLALAMVFVAAAVSLNTTTIRAACGAALVWGIPHLLYHVFNTDGLTTGDLIASLGGLVLFAALPLAILWWSAQLDSDESPGNELAESRQNVAETLEG